MSLVPESLYESRKLCEFERTGNVTKSLNIGMQQQIQNFVDKETPYEIEGEGNKYRWRAKKPLWISTKYGMTNFVKFLLDTGADPTANDSAALRWAAGLGYEEILKMLLDAGANPDAKGTLSRWQQNHFSGEAYRWAERNGFYNIIKALDQAKSGVKFFEPSSERAQQVVNRAMDKPAPEVEMEEVEEPENNGWF